MLKFLAVIFPLLVSVLAIKLMPYTLSDFFTTKELKNIKELTASESEHYGYQQLLLLFAGLIAFGVPIYFLQHFLSYQSKPDALFSHYVWLLNEYIMIQAFFFAILFAGVFSIRYTYVKHGRETVRNDLLSTMSGIPNYINLKYHKLFSICVGLIFTIMNVFFSNAFISVEPERLYFSYWSSLQTKSIEYDSIDCVIRYSRRIAPNGNVNFRPYLDIRLKNKDTVDTFYLIERKHHRMIFNAIEEAAKRKIPYIKIKSLKKKVTESPCDILWQSNSSDREQNSKSSVNQVQFYYNRGRSYEEKNKLDLALDDLLKVVDVEPENVNALELIGWIYLKQGNYSESITYYSRVLEYDPNNAKAYHNRAGLYARLGNMEKAKTDVTIACDKGYKDACMMLKRINNN